MIDITTFESRRDSDDIHSRMRIEGEHGDFVTHLSQRPDLTGKAPDIICFQGIMQSPGDTSAHVIHRTLFQTLPVASIATIGNNGMDINDGRDYATRNETAADRLELLERLTGNLGTYAVGFSLGSQTVNDLLFNNLHSLHRPPVNGVIHIAPGLIAPIRARDKTNQLPLNLVNTTTKRLMSHPLSIPANLWEMGQILNRTAWNQQPVEHQRRMVNLGTEPETIKEVAEYYPTDITCGVDDVVFDREMLLPLDDGNRLRVHQLRNIGHEMVFTPNVAVSAITHALNRIQERSSGLFAA